MKNYSKQFVALATDLKRNLFEAARLQLMGFYVLVMAFILLIFSSLLFYSLSNNLKASLEGQFFDEDIRQDVFEKTLNGIVSQILLIDLIVLSGVSIISYIIAGRSLRPIKQALEVQTRFSADASHELRTPLTVMKTESEVALQNPRLGEESRSFILSNLEEIDRMSSMVEDLLVFSRSDNFEQAVIFSPVNLEPVIDRVAHKLKVISERKGTVLVKGEVVAGLVWGSADDLQRVLTNLVQNAIQYTDSGGTVSMSLRREKKNMVLQVQDNGRGIESQDLPHIFEPFYRADRARSYKEGTGLGLPIVQRIIERHDGLISIKSKPGKGTAVTVSLPVYVKMG